MEKTKKELIDEQIKALEEEKRLIEEAELKSELKPSITKAIKEMSSSDEKDTIEVFNDYEIPSMDQIKDIESEISKFGKISIYSLILGLVITLILYFVVNQDSAISFLIGVFTSNFCLSILIKDTKNLAYVHISKYKSMTVKSTFKRIFIYLAILFFVFVFEDKGFVLIYTFAGMLLVKITTFIYFIVNKGRL